METSDKKILGRFDLVLFTVSAIVLLDTLAASASIGASSLFWWLFLGLSFMLPLGLITAELATTYPADGGLYVWIRKAFGPRWAARAIWAYWVNTAIWLPAIYVLFTGFASRLFGVELALPVQIGIGLALGWLTVGLDIIGLRLGKWVPNLGAALKFVVFPVLIIMGLRYGLQNGFANTFSVQTLSPKWEEGLQYLPAIIYGMLGFELVSAAGGNIKRPSRDIPAAILQSGLLVMALYSLSTLGILAAIPAAELDVVDGLVDTLSLLMADVPGGSFIVFILGLATLITFFSNGVTWALGCNRTAAEAALDGQLPAIFGVRHLRHGGPVGAAVMMGVVCSVTLICYGLIAESGGDLFWSLFSFSAVIFMLPYMGMVLAFMKLRLTDAERERPYRAPGGTAGAIVFAGLTFVILVASMILFFYTPGEGVQYGILIGAIIVVSMGEALILLGKGRIEGRIERVDVPGP